MKKLGGREMQKDQGKHEEDELFRVREKDAIVEK